MKRRSGINVWRQKRNAYVIERPKRKIEHPFSVGDKYRNRLGEYEVVSIDEPKIVVCYDDGTLLKGTVEILGRIWRNIQADEEAERAEQERRERAEMRRNQFRGLEEHDFGQGVRGTSWRRRDSLAGLLAQKVSSSTPYSFQSYVIRARPKVHIATEDYDNTKESRPRAARFVLDLDRERVRYGFNIRRKSGPLTGSWDWPIFVAAVEDNKALQAGIEAAMHKHNLHWQIQEWDGDGDDKLVTSVEPAKENGLVWHARGAEEGERITWAEFAARVRAIGKTRGCDLYLSNELDRDAAIAAGRHIVGPVAQVYRSLIPLYRTCALDADAA